MTEGLKNINQVSSRIDELSAQLSNHELYRMINTKEKLKIFMQHHVYAVWDFMSLIKALQKHIAPITIPWTPARNTVHVNFINQLVLGEESDYSLTDSSNSTHASHFESYLLAMEEINADTKTILKFIDDVRRKGLNAALTLQNIPLPAKRFMQFTFELIEQNKLHYLAAALAYSREDLVPQLFRALQDGMYITPKSAPNLYAYLQRHIQLDGEEHGPLAIRLLNELCEGSDQMHTDAAIVAERALEVRLAFWNGIQDAIVFH